MIDLPDSDSLKPQLRAPYGVFKSDTTDLLRIDLLFEAGSAYQPQPLCAGAANKLCTVATEAMDADTLSEFMDYRGAIIECDNGVLQDTITVYTLRRHAAEVLPVVADMIQRPLFAASDFATWVAKRKQEIMVNEQRGPVRARRLFYEVLFGSEHPLGRHAVAEDADRLSLDTVRDFYNAFHRVPTDITVAGGVDDEVINLLKSNYFNVSDRTNALISLASDGIPSEGTVHHCPLPGAVQTSIRVGRVLPLRWDSPDYATLMLAVTALGGYFGSRLMSNLREDKGYTYGIYARTQIYRGTIVFYITADVGRGMAQDSVEQVMHELRRMCDEVLSDEELQLVRTVMAGDFLRSVDGVFERAARFANMREANISQLFTDNLRRALREATPDDIRRVSAQWLQPSVMTVCTAGA